MGRHKEHEGWSENTLISFIIIIVKINCNYRELWYQYMVLNLNFFVGIICNCYIAGSERRRRNRSASMWPGPYAVASLNRNRTGAYNHAVAVSSCDQSLTSTSLYRRSGICLLASATAWRSVTGPWPARRYVIAGSDQRHCVAVWLWLWPTAPAQGWYVVTRLEL